MPADGVTDNQAKRRYELVVDGTTAYAEYVLADGSITFTHTIVPEALGGRGVGGRLVNAALDDAEVRGLKIVPECSFVAKMVERRSRR